jgi:hypothetical protein
MKLPGGAATPTGRRPRREAGGGDWLWAGGVVVSGFDRRRRRGLPRGLGAWAFVSRAAPPAPGWTHPSRWRRRRASGRGRAATAPPAAPGPSSARGHLAGDCGAHPVRPPGWRSAAVVASVRQAAAGQHGGPVACSDRRCGRGLAVAPRNSGLNSGRRFPPLLRPAPAPRCRAERRRGHGAAALRPQGPAALRRRGGQRGH